MFSFGSKPLENLLGAAYLTGALEALNKSKSLGVDETEKFFEDTKHVRRVLLDRAESDGYSKATNQIEEAKKVAKKTLNSKTSTNNRSNTKTNTPSTEETTSTPANTTPTNTPPTNTTPTNTPPTNTTPTNTPPTSPSASTLESNELMPLKNSVSTTNNKKPNVPPPILQLGGKRRRKTKKHKRRSK